MLENVKHTFKHTAVYSIGNMATKLIGVALLPLFIKHLSVAEYGLFGILDITIQILAQSLTLGQPQALLRIYNIDTYRDERKSAFFSITLFLFCIGFFMVLGGNFASRPLASLFSQPAEFAAYFKICAYIVFLRILTKLFISLVRAKEQSVLYIIMNLIKLGFILGFSIFFVAYADMGITGLLLAYLIGEGVLILLLFPAVIPEIKLQFQKSVLQEALTFGFPLIYSGLAHMILQMGDRYLLKLLVNYKEAGLYHLGYRIAGVLNMFIIIPFQMGWLPISFKMYGKEGDKRYYRKMMTYFMYLLIWSGLALSFFYKEILALFARNTDYWAAVVVVPLLIFGYLFDGGKIVANIGLYLKKKTRHIAYITILAVIINIGLNFLLIPRFRMVGAAVATIISFISLFIITCVVSHRFYPIGYEFKKIFTMLILSILLYIISLTLSNVPVWPRVMLKITILFTFPFILIPLGFYEQREIETIKRIIQRKKI